MSTYRLEMNVGQDIREVTADAIGYEGDWLIFYRKPPQGGREEHWRVRLDAVVSMETKRCS